MRTVFVVALALVGCGPAAGSRLSITPAEYDATVLSLRDLAAGDLVDLVRPPQGGFVTFVGARVRNLESGDVELRGRLLDPSTGAIRFGDTRTTMLLRDASDPSLWSPDLRSYTSVPNIAVCPAGGASDLWNAPFLLEVDVRETATGRTGSLSLAVTTACRQTDPTALKLCQCECAGNFYFGKCGTGT